jgi:hypothetical protein
LPGAERAGLFSGANPSNTSIPRTFAGEFGFRFSF